MEISSIISFSENWVEFQSPVDLGARIENKEFVLLFPLLCVMQKLIFLSHENKEHLYMLAQKNEYLQETIPSVRKLTEDEKTRQQCQAGKILNIKNGSSRIIPRKIKGTE